MNPKDPQAELSDVFKTMLRQYRIRANMAYSEVEDKFYTQAEYEKALTKLENTLADSLQSYLQAHQQQLLSELLGQKQPLATRNIIHPDLLEAVPVSVIKSKIGELNG